ncbi:hypothetical protein, partial [uncultured Muribaculum sp.]|uniref:hypothetical protein n=1 Tax=uncultured Muribaculum sp. TaxID=1918613 RepID=UPI002659C128
ATKIAKIFQIVIIWNIFEKKILETRTKKCDQYTIDRLHFKRPPIWIKKARTRQQSAIQAHLYTNCVGDVKKPRCFLPPIAPFCKADVRIV